MCRVSGSTVEITRSLATLRAIRHVPWLDRRASTSWPATNANSPTSCCWSSSSSTPSTAARIAQGVVDQPGDQLVTGGRVVPRARRLARPSLIVMRRQRQRLPRPGSPCGPGGSSTPTASPCPASRPRHPATSSPAPDGSCRQHPRRARPRHARRRRSAPDDPTGRSLLRHNVNTVGWNPSSVIDRPAATFQRRSVANACTASRSDSPSSDCNTITVAITSAGTDGRPRPDGNRSANNSSGNSRRRCSAKNAYTDPAGTRCPTERRRVQQLDVRIRRSLHPPIFVHPTENREPFTPDCSAVS